MTIDLIYPLIFVISSIITYFIVNNIENTFFSEVSNKVITSLCVGIIACIVFYFSSYILTDDLLTTDFYTPDVAA